MNKKRKKNILYRSFYSLVELLVVIAIFTVLLAVIARFFSAAHDASTQLQEHSMLFENAKVALDLISHDIQSIYYENGQTPFWHWRPPSSSSPPASWGSYRNEFLAFVSATSIPQNDNCTSSLCEIKYQKYYATNHSDPNDGWLRRSVTGNKKNDGTDNPKWNFQNNLVVGFKTPSIIPPLEVIPVPVAAITANSDSNEDYQKVIPYVTDLSFICYDKDGYEITPDQTTSTSDDAGTVTEFPFSIQISLTVMSKNAWQKWVALGGDVNPKNDTGTVKAFREKHERVFTKTVLIGNRGQYE